MGGFSFTNGMESVVMPSYSQTRGPEDVKPLDCSKRRPYFRSAASCVLRPSPSPYNVAYEGIQGVSSLLLFARLANDAALLRLARIPFFGTRVKLKVGETCGKTLRPPEWDMASEECLPGPTAGAASKKRGFKSGRDRTTEAPMLQRRSAPSPRAEPQGQELCRRVTILQS